MKHLLNIALAVTVISLLACTEMTAQPNITAQQFATGFTSPVDIQNAGDERLFIVEQRGVIKILDENGNTNATPFLDIDPRVASGGERGLLGLAFHPDYKTNGYFYVNYTINGLQEDSTRISRFSVDPNDPNKGDPDSEVILLNYWQQFSNHNGGWIGFGPDGYLYVSAGDGGSGGDPSGNGQNKNTLLAAMLRLDVDGASLIPADNPFVGQANVKEEIWAYGIRNAWRNSFDRQTGDLWIADVGQNAYEEVNFQPASSAGGENYGWRCREGLHSYSGGGCGIPADNVDPIFEYGHNVGVSLTGGYVYRGCKYPNLVGKYICADYGTGNWWTIEPDGLGGWTGVMFSSVQGSISTFGQDIYGELYAANLSNGRIYKVVETDASGMAISASTTDALGAGGCDGAIDLTVSGGTAPYTYSWNTGSTDPDLSGVCADNYVCTVTDAGGCASTVTVSLSGQPTGIFETVEAVSPEVYLFPNPATQDVSIELKGMDKPELITVRTLTGEVVKTMRPTSGGIQHINVRNWAAGVYLVTARSGDHDYTGKFTVVD